MSEEDHIVMVSIIICTSNRSKQLRETMNSLSSIHVSPSMQTELLIVDNGSTDDTIEIANGCRLSNMDVRYLFEQRRGQCYARNSGIRAAQGNIILFTDDDVRPAKDWIAGMCAPILAGEAQAVLGGVRIPDTLLRPWMEPLHRAWMASTEGLDVTDPPALVGANMAFSREVLNKVPAFDTELGPGALGFCDETLFSLQIKKSGGRIAAAYETEVEHHFDADRLTRANFLKRAVNQGKSLAYMSYHWQHEDIPDAAFLLRKRLLRLWYRRWKHRAECLEPEGAPEWELNLLKDAAYYRQFLVEKQRPRNYDKFGLVKHEQNQVKQNK